ncbi:MAG: TonB-dependent receptor [Deltaproteobacteria bacterium]|nr:MAG: TonB-dependent receptor [Deltaproteobacteria bacterium]
MFFIFSGSKTESKFPGYQEDTKRRKKMKRTLYCLVLLTFLAGGYVQAQPVREQADSLDTITVTAQKTEENLQDVPVSVSIFDDLALEDREIHTLRELVNYVPGFYLPLYGDFGIAGPSMRGICSHPSTMTSSVGMYIDGIPTTSVVGFLALMNDVAQVEVLRGPQGTLYGKNAQAGVITITTKKPGNEREGRIYTEIAEDDKHEIGLGFRTPIVRDKFYFGLTGRFYEKDGYLKNTYLNKTANDRENYFGRLHLRMMPSPRLDMSLISSRYKTDDGGTSANGYTAADLWKAQYDLDQYSKTTVDSHALKIRYDFDAFTLESITGYKKTRLDNFLDQDFSPMEIFHALTDMPSATWSEEIRLNGETKKFKWLLGLYADKTEQDVRFIFYMPPMIQDLPSDRDQRTFGIFAHFDYALTDQLSLIAGLRYDKEKKEIRDYGLHVFAEEDYSSLSPKLALEYKVSSGLSTYATVAKGYKSGGFYTFAIPGYPYDYEPENLWNYELGVKTLWLDERFMVNGSVYYMDISDMQVLTLVEGTPGGYIGNAASATSMGLELETNYIVNEHVSCFANLGLNRARFDSFSDAGGVYDDNDTPDAPRYNYAVGFTFRGFGGFYASADITGQGKSYLDKANLYPQKARHLVNAKVGYEWENIDLYIYGKNIFEEEYHRFDGTSGRVLLSDPGEVGVRLTWRF